MVPRPWLRGSPVAAILAMLILSSSFINTAWAQKQTYVTYTDTNGDTVSLLENRQPALYTQNFGDCLGGSLLEISRFDAAYYKDNMTILFHVQGESTVSNISLIMSISVYAYGESRYTKLFDPCAANINSLCPTNTSQPIVASAIIPVADSDVAGIPPLALAIPDFEGQAILRIFSNATQSEIACFSATITNGNSFSHPGVVGSIMGIFTFAALLASFAAVAYGNHIPTIRTHYAHSMSVFVVFAVYHHVYYTGALSVNWPVVLPSFWSNFAWASGMIYSEPMMNSINKLLGVNLGNTTVVGAANQGSSSDGTGGGYQISAIYKRASEHVFSRTPGRYSDVVDMVENMPKSLGKRGLENSTTGFDWYGVPVGLGLPLPGNYSGFAGTLSAEGIPASNAFLTGFLWFLIILVLVVTSVIAVKWIMEGLSKMGWVKQDRLELFRYYWIGYTALAAARTFFIAFFMMMFLTIFQFLYKGSTGIIAVAAVVFAVFFFGLLGIAALACFYRLRFGQFSTVPDRVHLEQRKLFDAVPWIGIRSEHSRNKKTAEPAPPSAGSLPWWRIEYVSADPQSVSAHEDDEFVKRYGWLSARFRRTRWWFFSFWLIYEFIRACFLGGAASHPKVQIFGLLAVEIVALILISKLKPFEGARLNVLMVYFLGFSKIACVGLSAAFLAEFNLARIPATVVGVVIIVIQSFLLIALLIFIIIGAMSTRMSTTRDSEVEASSEDWANLRARYFKSMDRAAADENSRPTTRPQTRPSAPAIGEPKAPHFNVNSIRRVPKIEDHDDEDEAQNFDPYGSRISLADNTPGSVTRRTSRANSMRSTMSYSNLPFGARPHRQSWTTQDFQSFQESQRHSSVFRNTQGMRSDTSVRDGYSVPARSRASSRPQSMSGTSQSIPLEVRKVRNSTRANIGKGKEHEPTLDEEEDRISHDDRHDDQIGFAS